MAQISVPIKIDGLNFVIGVMKSLVERTDFKKYLSEDYNNGYYDCSNAIITVLP